MQPIDSPAHLSETIAENLQKKMVSRCAGGLSRDLPAKSTDSTTSATQSWLAYKPPQPWLSDLLADAVHDQRADWQAECATVKAAFERWLLAPPERRAQAYIAYTETLDQEEQAARIYRDLLRELATPRRDW